MEHPMKNAYVGFILLHQRDMLTREVEPIFIRMDDISCVSTQTIAGQIYTKIMLNNQQVVYAIESINEIMEEIA